MAKKTPSCMLFWQYLSATATLLALTGAVVLLVRNIVFMHAVDVVIEKCTGDENNYYPCHYVQLWNKQHNFKVYDLRHFASTLFTSTIVFVIPYILTGFAAITGIVKRNGVLILPWLVYKGIVCALLLLLISSELSVTGSGSLVLWIVIGCFGLSLLTWFACLTAYLLVQQDKTPVKPVLFSYIRL